MLKKVGFINENLGSLNSRNSSSGSTFNIRLREENWIFQTSSFPRENQAPGPPFKTLESNDFTVILTDIFLPVSSFISVV